MAGGPVEMWNCTGGGHKIQYDARLQYTGFVRGVQIYIADF